MMEAATGNFTPPSRTYITKILIPLKVYIFIYVFVSFAQPVYLFKCNNMKNCILHGFCCSEELLFDMNNSWFTIILWVSILFLANSCTNLSVSYNDKNSAMQTHINVVSSY